MLAAFDKLAVREFRMLLLGAGLVITSVAVTAALLPGAKAYRAAGNAVAVLEVANENQADLEQQLQERRTKIDELKFRLHGDMANLPPKEIESYVIGRLQKISWSNNVDLISIQPAAGTTGTDIQRDAFQHRTGRGIREHLSLAMGRQE